jgi:hypothetical protein
MMMMVVMIVMMRMDEDVTETD